MSRKLVGYLSLIVILVPFIVFNLSFPVSASSLNVYGCNHSPSSIDPGITVTITCSFTESQILDIATWVNWRVNGGTFQDLLMTESGSTFTKAIGSFSAGDFVEYYVDAWGEDINYALVSDRDPLSGYRSFTVTNPPVIYWSSPVANSDIVFDNVLGPYSFSFNWGYTSIDDADLILGDNTYDVLTSGVKTTSVSFNYALNLEGTVTAELIGYSGGNQVAASSRNFNFIWLPNFDVHLSSPTGGEKYENEVPIVWQVTTDVKTVYTSYLDYTDDSGSTWHSLTSGITESTYVWDTTSLSYGSDYRIRVTVTGTYLGQNLDTTSDSSLIDFTINPDIAGPIITSSNNVAYFIGKNGSYLTWTMFDRNPANYSVLLDNNYIIEDMPWNDGQLVNISVDGLGLGHYEYKLISEDSWGYQSEKILFVDVIIPSIEVTIISPTGGSSYENEIAITWSVITDADTIYSSLLEYSNDSGFTWYPLVNGFNQTYYLWNTTILPNGSEYLVRVTVTGTYLNESLNTAIDTLVINFSLNPDTETPVITSSDNVTYVLGKNGYFLSWILNDRNPENFSVLSNNSYILENLSWTDGQTVNISIDGLIPGFYEYKLIADDIWGYRSENTLYVQVILPTLDVILITPQNNSFYLDEVEINWLVESEDSTDYSSLIEYSNNDIDWYEIAHNVSTTTLLWNTHTIIPGISYQVRITVNATYLGYSLPTSTVKTIGTFTIDPDIYAPIISHPNDVIYEFGTIDNVLNWSITDRNPYNYSITRNGENIVVNSVWISNQSIESNIDNLPVGAYNFIISVQDIWGQETSDLVMVQVKDTIAPTITILSPNRGKIFSINTSFTTITYLYSASDMSNFSVTIFLNQSRLDDTGELKNLSEGFYILNATAIDKYGNTNYSITEFKIVQEEKSLFTGLISDIDFSFLVAGSLLLGSLGFVVIFSMRFRNTSINLFGKKPPKIIGNKKLPPLDPMELESLSDDDFLR